MNIKTQFSTAILLLSILTNLNAQIQYKDEISGKYGLIDLNGKVITEPVFDEMNLGEGGLYNIEFYNGYASAYLNKKFYLIDNLGNFDESKGFDWMLEPSENLVAVKNNGQWGFIDYSGNVVIPFEYDNVGCMCDGIAWVQQGQVYGFINKSGEQITPNWYSEVIASKNGKAFAKKGDNIFEVTIDGAISSDQKPKFRYYLTKGCYKNKAIPNNDFIKFKNDKEKWGFKNSKGKVVIKPKFSKVEDYLDNMAIVTINKEVGVIDTKGKYIIEPTDYVQIQKIHKDYFYVTTKDWKRIKISNDGNIISKK